MNNPYIPPIHTNDNANTKTRNNTSSKFKTLRHIHAPTTRFSVPKMYHLPSVIEGVDLLGNHLLGPQLALILAMGDSLLVSIVNDTTSLFAGAVSTLASGDTPAAQIRIVQTNMLVD